MLQQGQIHISPPPSLTLTTLLIIFIVGDFEVLCVDKGVGPSVEVDVDDEVAADEEDVVGMRGGGEIEEAFEELTFCCLDELILKDGLIAD